MAKKVHIKTGDTVVLLSGKYNDKFVKEKVRRTGKVLEVSPSEGKVIVEGINFVTKHVKPKMGQPGGVVKAEAPIHACKLQLVCPKCSKPTRVGRTFEGEGKNRKKLRVCKKCGESFR